VLVRMAAEGSAMVSICGARYGGLWPWVLLKRRSSGGRPVRWNLRTSTVALGADAQLLECCHISQEVALHGILAVSSDWQRRVSPCAS